GEGLRCNADTLLGLSDADAIRVAERVRPALNANDNIMVLPIDPTANVGGFAPQSVWDLVFKRSPFTLNALAEGKSGLGGLLGTMPHPGSLGALMPPFGPDKKD